MAVPRKEDAHCGEQPQAQLLLCANYVNWQISNDEVRGEVTKCRDIFTDFLPPCFLGSLKLREGLVSLNGFYNYIRLTQDIFPFD